MATTIDIKVPDIGEFDDVPVIEILVSVGDRVEAEQSLVTLESDKATMEVPSPAAGVIKELKVSLNDAVSEGHVVAVLETDDAGDTAEPEVQASDKPSDQADASSADEQAAADESPAAAPDGEREQAAAERNRQPAAPVAAEPSAGSRQSPPVVLGADAVMPGRLPYASPAMRAFARELGVDLLRVKGSGRKGRIQREDISAYVKAALQGGGPQAGSGFEVAAAPSIDFSKFGETELQPLSRIKKISGKNLHRNWVTIPHVTHNDLADITAMEDFRQANKGRAKEQGVNLTPLAFIIKAAVHALQAFPNFNASLDEAGENLVLKRYYHIGIAVDTPDGLVVPALRDCDSKSVLELAVELGEVSQRARDGKLKPADWQGASFSISSLGGIGGVSFSPIINLPEVAILGVSRASLQPVWSDDAFQPRLMLPLSLSYDHRVIDGAQAARFTRAMAAYLGDESQLSL
jgi:pyruvate dehydrogenase E2 component (dihydrolipoamide acetyltransferase)